MAIRRMPITYYFIGTILQFILILIVRFAYRFILLERSRRTVARSKKASRVMLVGAGAAGRSGAGFSPAGPEHRPGGGTGEAAGYRRGTGGAHRVLPGGARPLRNRGGLDGSQRHRRKETGRLAGPCHGDGRRGRE